MKGILRCFWERRQGKNYLERRNYLTLWKIDYQQRISLPPNIHWRTREGRFNKEREN